VRSLGGGKYSVPTLLERSSPDGTWTPVACEVRIQRESYRAWRVTSLRLPGEAARPLDLLDAPLGGPRDLWTWRMLERVGLVD
jgi:hypothetical protein